MPITSRQEVVRGCDTAKAAIKAILEIFLIVAIAQ